MSDIDEVRERIDLVELVRETLPLQKSGRNWKANCPFHTEKTPSFYVFPDRQTWRCFGACAEGGDVFSFVMKRDSIGFGEALSQLARRAGVELSRRGPAESNEDRQQRERLVSANSIAAAFYARLLREHPAAAEARAYLERRHLTADAIERFQLGFAPDEWHALELELVGLGFSRPDLVAAGLLTENEEGRIWDRFRHKIMFPIRDRDGRVIGFGARALDDSNPKYLNSPQTPLFDKSSVLYALDKAGDTIRKENLVVLVEGYMDAIMAHQHGFTNVVASLGTALTDRQVGILKRVTRRIALCLDADQAGVDAMLRGYQVAREAFDQKTVAVPTARGLIRYQTSADAEIRIVALPWGKDPDEVIHEDPDLWRRLVFDAQPVVDFIFDATFKAHNTRDPQGKRAIVDALTPVLQDIANPVSQAHYLQRLAHVVQMDERQLAAYISSRRPAGRRTAGAGARSGSAAQPVTAAPGPGARNVLEEHALALLLRYPQLSAAGHELQPDTFEWPEHRAIYQAWLDAGGDRAATEAALDSSLRERFGMILDTPAPPLEAAMAEADWRQTARRLQERRQRRQIEAMAAVLAEVESATSPDAIATTAYQAMHGHTPDAPEAVLQAVAVEEMAVIQAPALKSLLDDRAPS